MAYQWQTTPFQWNTSTVPGSGGAQPRTGGSGGSGGQNTFSGYGGGNTAWSPSRTKQDWGKVGSGAASGAAAGASVAGGVGAIVGGLGGAVGGFLSGRPKDISPEEQWASNVGIEGNKAWQTFVPWARTQQVNALGDYTNKLQGRMDKFEAGQGLSAQGNAGADALQGYLGRAEQMRPDDARALMAKFQNDEQNVNKMSNIVTRGLYSEAQGQNAQLKANPFLSAAASENLKRQNLQGAQQKAAEAGVTQLGGLQDRQVQLAGQITNFLSSQMNALTSGYSSLANVRANLARLAMEEGDSLLAALGNMPEQYASFIKSLLPPQFAQEAAKQGGRAQASGTNYGQIVADGFKAYGDYKRGQV